MTDKVISERRESYALITINNAGRRNALGTETMEALSDALTAHANDPECAAIVLTGAPPAFCAGSDLKELGGMTVPEMCVHEAETARIARSIGMLPKPVIAAVEGYALGGGFILATSCDIVVTAETARWSLPEVPNGWLPPWGIQTLLARVGPVRARLVTWGIADIDGPEAYRLGIADFLTPEGGAAAKACEIAGRIAALPSNAVTSTKRFFETWTTADAERQDAEANRVFAEDCESDAAKEVLARFANKS